LAARETTACVLRHIGQLELFCHRPGMSRAVQALWECVVRGPKWRLAQSGRLRIGAADTTLRPSEPRLGRS
jgi:hypothetical protein